MVGKDLIFFSSWILLLDLKWQFGSDCGQDKVPLVVVLVWARETPTLETKLICCLRKPHCCGILFVLVSGNGDGKDVSFSLDSVAGSGGGEAFTPNDQVKVTKENLMEKMEQLQADFKRLEEEELKEPPAQAVKKRKRRQSSGKSGK